MCPGAALKAGFGCSSGPLTPLPVRIPCAWAFLCPEHQAGAVGVGMVVALEVLEEEQLDSWGAVG